MLYSIVTNLKVTMINNQPTPIWDLHQRNCNAQHKKNYHCTCNLYRILNWSNCIFPIILLLYLMQSNSTAKQQKWRSLRYYLSKGGMLDKLFTVYLHLQVLRGSYLLTANKTAVIMRQKAKQISSSLLHFTTLLAI